MLTKKKSPVKAKQLNELVETSKKYIASKVLTKFYNLPIEIDDLESVIYEGVKKALSSYDSNRSSSKASLTSWAIIYSTNECMNYIRKFISKRSNFNNEMIPFSKVESYKIDAASSDDDSDIEKIEFRYFLENDLSQEEKEVAQLIGEGLNKKEICAKLTISYHQLQEIISDIRIKFTKTK